MSDTRPTDYDAIIFDNDGVIVEPTDTAAIADAVVEAVRVTGHTPDRAAVERAVSAGAGPHETLRIFREHADGQTDVDPGAALDIDLEGFWRRRERRAAARQKRLIENGGKDLYDDVSALASLEVRLGMVSNNQAETVSFIVDHYGLGFFEVVYGREPSVAGAERKKPDPYYLEQALADLGTRDALYVGDSVVDVQAARRAGVDSAFLRRAHSADTDLPVEPTFEVIDLHALADIVTGPEG